MDTHKKQIMKPKLLLAAAFCVFTFKGFSQIDKGQGFIGGSLSFGTRRQTLNSSSLNTLTLIPRGAYFVANNLALGLETPLNLSKLRGENYIAWNNETGYYENTFGPKEFSFGISPFLRKYVDVNSRMKYFFQANLLMQINTFNRVDQEGYLIRTDAKIKGYGASVSPGFAFFINRRTSLEFSFPIVTYFHQNYYDYDSMYNFDKTNTVRLALDNFTPIVGVNFQL